MKCPMCGCENPQDARFCQFCGGVVTPGNQYQRYQFEPGQISKGTTPLPAYNEEAMRKACLLDTTVLTIVSLSALVFCVLAIGELDGRYPNARLPLSSTAVNAFVALLVGVGMVAHLLSQGSASAKSKREVAEHEVKKSFIGTMEPSRFYGAVLRSRESAMMPEARVSAGVKALLYLLSVFVPAAGLITGAALYVNSEKGYKRLGKTCIEISTVILLVLTLLVAIVYLSTVIEQ